MVSAAIKRASAEEGKSLRQIGRNLGYKQAVVLSHMALGRVPVPIERVDDLAKELRLDPAQLLKAALLQRYPEVRWHLLSSLPIADKQESLAGQLESILGVPLSELSDEHRAMFQEIAAARQPRRQWLRPSEVPAIEMLRELRPNIRERGLDAEDVMQIRFALHGPR